MLEIGRRRFLQGTGVFLVSAGLPKLAVAKPNKGGHFRIGIAGGSTQDSLDPSRVLYDSTFLIAATVRNSLVGLDPSGKLLPNLAEKWEASDDFKKWTFYIRPGVTFHSGKPLEMEDIIASLSLHRGAASTSQAKPLMAAVTDIAADGPNKVVISLNGPNVDFASLMRDLRLTIIPAKNGKADAGTMDGTGPYIFDQFEPGQRMSFKRNPNYWDTDNAGFFDSAEVLIIPDAAARMNALRSGQVDMVNNVDLKAVTLLKRLPGIVVGDVPSGRHYVFGMMETVAPFNDKNVRQALKYAMKRQELVDKILLGHGTIGNDQPIDRAQKYYNAGLPQREFDPDKVKFHMKAAGLSKLEVPLSVSDAAFDGAISASTLYTASAAQAGVTIDVTREPDDAYFTSVWNNKPFTVDYWNKLASADAQLTIAYAKDATANETHFSNPRFNELLVSARATADEEKRTNMYHEMQQLIYEESGAIIPMFANYVWASKESVKHQPQVSNYNDLDGYRCISNWWFG
jgi:peptide/nickel transport system substrate-binding protein